MKYLTSISIKEESLNALRSSGVEYLIGGAIAEWAWEEPRATQGLDVVVKIPIKSINKLSKQLRKRDMLIPVEIILVAILEGRASIPINAIRSRDTAAILKSKEEELDTNYIDQWATRLGLSTLWKEMLDNAS